MTYITRPLGYNGAMQEGRAARRFNQLPAANGYRSLLTEYPDDSKLQELANDWDSGYAHAANEPKI